MSSWAPSAPTVHELTWASRLYLLAYGEGDYSADVYGPDSDPPGQVTDSTFVLHVPAPAQELTGEWAQRTHPTPYGRDGYGAGPYGSGYGPGEADGSEFALRTPIPVQETTGQWAPLVHELTYGDGIYGDGLYEP